MFEIRQDRSGFRVTSTFVFTESDLSFFGMNAKGEGLMTTPRLSACKFPDHLAALYMLPVGCLCLVFKIPVIVISVFLWDQSPVI